MVGAHTGVELLFRIITAQQEGFGQAIWKLSTFFGVQLCSINSLIEFNVFRSCEWKTKVLLLHITEQISATGRAR